ncbi:MAG TPA: amidohydrolase family protein [Polyangiaceae bacterium]
MIDENSGERLAATRRLKRSMKIDAHQHFWEYDPRAYSWIDESMAVLKGNYLPERLAPLLQHNGFTGSIAVQASTTVTETRFYLELARANPFIRGVVGWVNLCAPDVSAVLADLSTDTKLVGIRHVVQGEADDFMYREDFRRGIGALAPFGLAYDILVYARQMPAALDLARAFPEQRFVLDHLGKPPIRDGELEPWRTHIRELAALPNVYCKLSGLVTEADWQHWTPGQLAPYLNVSLECFGARRAMIGSDWPVCTLAAPYERVVGVVLDFIEHLSPDEQSAIFGDTAASFYRLG